jgi:chromosome segregation ATPase
MVNQKGSEGLRELEHCFKPEWQEKSIKGLLVDGGKLSQLAAICSRYETTVLNATEQKREKEKDERSDAHLKRSVQGHKKEIESHMEEVSDYKKVIVDNKDKIESLKKEIFDNKMKNVEHKKNIGDNKQEISATKVKIGEEMEKIDALQS